MAEPDAFVLGAAGVSDDAETIVWDIMYTTGSSGKPTPFVSTSYDFVNILALNRNMMRLRGVTTADTILNLFPLTRYPHGAFRAGYECGGRDEYPRSWLHYRATPMSASLRSAPASMRWSQSLSARARQFCGACRPLFAKWRRAPKSSAQSCRRSGSSLSPAKALATRRARILRTGYGRLGATASFISVSYGATEMQGGMVECAAGRR